MAISSKTTNAQNVQITVSHVIIKISVCNVKLVLPKHNKKSAKDVSVTVKTAILLILTNVWSDVNKESFLMMTSAHLVQNSAINANHRMFAFNANLDIFLSRKFAFSPVNKDAIHAFRRIIQTAKHVSKDIL